MELMEEPVLKKKQNISKNKGSNHLKSKKKQLNR